MHYEQVLAEENQAYEQNLSVMRSFFEGCGCRITPMSDDGTLPALSSKP